eukprot:scaffold43139_cov199-Amphora_coffeaeformis.AAC.1
MELAPLTNTTAKGGEDWWENEEEHHNAIIQTQSKWKAREEESDGSCYYSRPWWIGLTIAILVVVVQVLVLSMTDGADGSAASSSSSSSGPLLDAVVAERSFPVVGIRSGDTYNVTQQGQEQVQNYLDDKALILNVHITHHGGTTFCHFIGRSVGAPSFACMGVRPQDNVTTDDFSKNYPWSHNQTEEKIEKARQYFHMLSWEFGRNKARPLAETNWEAPRLVSVLVLRHPLSRMLSGIGKIYPRIKDGTADEEEWWRFAKDKRQDNFALSYLLYRNQGSKEVTADHLKAAKKLVRRFTFVLDLSCLGESIAALADVLGIPQSEEKPPQTIPHPPPRDRVPFPEVYDYLEHRNRYDIELYEWSKSLSLVKCDELPKNR